MILGYFLIQELPHIVVRITLLRSGRTLLLTGKAPPWSSISEQPLTVFGRRLVKVDEEGQPCLLHIYVCDVPCCVWFRSVDF